MKTSFWRHAILTVILWAVALSSTPHARADNFQVYQVTGTMTFIGSNACTGTTCVETVNFSFEHSCTVESMFGAAICDNGGIVPGTATATIAGPFGISTVAGYLGPGYIGFNPPSDISQLYTNVTPDFFSYAITPGSTPQFLFDAELWSCVSSQCLTDFGAPFDQLGVGGPIANGALQYTTTLIPEPPTTLLLGFGTIFLAAFATVKRKLAA